MDKHLMAGSSSLLGQALSLASQKAQTLESFASALNASAEESALYWFTVNSLRRCQGRCLPAPASTAFGEDESGGCHGSSDWYAPTWRLSKLLETYQINEGLAVHYETILTEPEGGHYELNLAASDVVAAVRLENPALDAARMKRICVQACAPASGIELLVSNAGQILLNIENYRDEPLTAAFIEGLYQRLVKGISIKDVREMGRCEASAMEDLRLKTLESFCADVWRQESERAGGFGTLGDPAQQGEHALEGESTQEGATAGPRAAAGARVTTRPQAVGGPQTVGGSEDPGDCGNHALINALIALRFFRTFHVFPAGNDVLAYLLYFLILHRAGYHFSAHVPVVTLLYADDGGDGRVRRLPRDPESLVVECDGSYDWTRFFEGVVAAIVEEQRWTMTKLDGMSRRRERFRAIIDADESMNFRQKEVLLEAVLHSNAEFTYAIHEQRYDVSYPCARSDYAGLLDRGFLRQHDDGIRHFFVASDNFNEVFLTYLKEHCPEDFFRYYCEDGSLRDEYKSTGDVASEYNAQVGFYEKSLLDKTYVEHYDYRRTSIADEDGPRRRPHHRG